MRAQRAVLREIAERNLNPKIVYVAGKDGQLVEKKKPEFKASEAPKVEDVIETSTPAQVQIADVPVESVGEEVDVVESAPTQEEVKPKKKSAVKKKETTDE